MADNTFAGPVPSILSQPPQLFGSINRGTENELNKANGPTRIKNTDFNPPPKLDYVTASQGKIFLDGVLIDEAYDIQYTYQESKEPIYGYNSKYFDAIVPGNVIVYGNFTINYKHDAYLHSILSAVAKVTTVEQAKAKREIGINLGNRFANYVKKYRSIQLDINNKKKALKALQAEKLEVDGALLLEKKDIELSKLNAEARVNNAKAAIDNYWNTKDANEQAFIVSKIAEFNDKAVGKGGQWESYHSVKSVKDKIASTNLDINNKIQVLSNQMLELESKKREKESLIQELEIEKSKINMGLEIEDFNLIQDDIETESSNLADLNNDIEHIYSQISDLETQRDLEQAKYSEALQQRELELKELKDATPELAEALSLDLDYERAKAEQELIGDNTLVTETEQDRLDIKISKAESDIKSLEIDLNDTKDFLASIKELQREAGMTILEDLALAKTDAEEKRAEDFRTFNIFIEYNGSIHKILKDCTLTGHSHVLSQSGQVVKEFYNFFCKTVV